MGKVVQTWTELESILNERRRQGDRIVSTNGVFDVLHVGHARYLAMARQFGDLLVVGINSDACTRALKGPNRPIVPAGERAELVAALACVDYVTLFDEMTPESLLAIVRPTVHVKGGDYDVDAMPETTVVRSAGGEVVTAPFVAGYSTTGVVDRILKTFMPEPILPSTEIVSEPIVGHPDARAKPGIWLGLLRAVRLKQATKNLFVFAAIIFVGKLFEPHAFLLVLCAFLLFTIVTGSVYLLNDILDVEQDRQHPKKRFRPIASGDLPISAAYAALFVLAIGGLLVSFLFDPYFGFGVLAYLLLQYAYCFRLKHIVLLDVFAIAAGFVLRAVAGAMVIHATISHWLLLCTLQLALFLGFGKRRQEIVMMGDSAGKTRAILEDYSLPFLDQMINMVSAVTIVCYSVYTVESPTAKMHPHLWFTVPIVIYAVCRYLYLVYQKGWGGAPDEVLLKDRSLQVAILLWFVVVVVLFKYDIRGHGLLPAAWGD